MFDLVVTLENCMFDLVVIPGPECQHKGARHVPAPIPIAPVTKAALLYAEGAGPSNQCRRFHSTSRFKSGPGSSTGTSFQLNANLPTCNVDCTRVFGPSLEGQKGVK
jgi:hypothetical protein